MNTRIQEKIQQYNNIYIYAYIYDNTTIHYDIKQITNTRILYHNTKIQW